uniref:Uncharacterized protein n=1 Tax=Rhizophora mucronata TaxID=61149 RepID=A0A2P2QIE4_RHIMU
MEYHSSCICLAHFTIQRIFESINPAPLPLLFVPFSAFVFF